MIVQFEQLKNGIILQFFKFIQFTLAWPIKEDPQFAISIGIVGCRLEIRLDGNDY